MSDDEMSVEEARQHVLREFNAPGAYYVLVPLEEAVRAKTLAEQRAREEMAVILVAAAANAVVEAYADEPPEHQVMQRDMRAFIEGLPVSDEARRFCDEVTASFKERAVAAEARAARLAAKAESALTRFIEFEHTEVAKDEFAYDRLHDNYRDAARRYLTDIRALAAEGEGDAS